MKKIVLAFLFVAFASQAQETEFKFTKFGFTDYIVTQCEGKKQAELYAKTLEWAAKTFTHKKDVKTEVENESILIKSSSSQLVCFNMMGKSCAKAKYVIEISFKDGKYKFDTSSTIDYLYGDEWKKIDLNNTYIYYDKDGEIRSNYKYFPEIADYFNSLNKQLKDFIVNYKVPEKKSKPATKSDW